MKMRILFGFVMNAILCLNKQIGFSEIYDEWVCDQCGHENHISEDEIYDSREEYEFHQLVDGVGKMASKSDRGSRGYDSDSGKAECRA